MRALLRLVRAEMGRRRYTRARKRLRRTSRSLASVRDAKAILTLSEQLSRHRRRPKTPAASVKLHSQLAMARRELSASHRRSMARDLMSAQKTMARWAGSTASRDRLFSALRREYSRARAAFETTRRTPSSAHFHKLRKRTKSLLYMCEFLARVSPYAGSKATQLKQLSHCLGDVHDLAILRDTHTSGHIEPIVRGKQQTLQRDALRLAATVYSEPLLSSHEPPGPGSWPATPRAARSSSLPPRRPDRH